VISLTIGEARELKTLPRSLIVIGGSYIALELGQFFSRLGTAVTILERSSQIFPDYEPEVGELLSSILREEGGRDSNLDRSRCGSA